jgi:hypothetical protein
MPQANINTMHAMNGIARLLPIFDRQKAVYRMGERTPAGLRGYQPRWEVVNAIIAAQQTYQTRVDLMPDFHLLAVLGSATVNNLGGFRVQLYDDSRKIRLQSRGLQYPNFGGASGKPGSFGPYFLREPYPFDLERSQLLVILQNMEVSANTIQIVLYGVAAPFTGRDNAGQ